MEWRDILIVSIHKKKRAIQDCGDCRGIKLIYFGDLGNDC